MAKAKLAFKERDIMRALRACRKEGLPVGRVVVDTTGNIVVIAAQPGDDAPLTAGDTARLAYPKATPS